MKRADFLFFGVVLVVVLFIFRAVFISHQVPFSGNLLVSFYQPWKSYTTAAVAKPLGFDSLRSFYPTRTLVTNSLKLGKLPLWNPHSFSGNVLLGAYQSAVFFPLGFLFLLLPQINAWTVIIILIPLFAYIFTYFFLREFGLSKIASFFGAFTWAFSGMMVVWWEEMFMAVYSIITLPLVLYAIEKRSYFFLVTGLAFSIFSGWFQATFYLLVLSLAWVFFRRKNLLFIFYGYITAFLLSGIQLIPGFEAYLQSSRGGTDTRIMFEQFFAKLSQLSTFLTQDFFGNPATQNYFASSFYHEQVIWLGIPAFVFILYELFHIFRAKPVSRFFAISGLVTLSLGFNLPTSWFVLYTLHLPFISEMTPSRIFFLSGFCLSVLAALGLERFMKKQNWFLMLLLLFGLLLAFAFSWWWGWKFQVLMTYVRDIHAWVPLRNLVIPSAIFFATSIAILLNKFHARVAFTALIAVSLLSAFYFSQKYLYFSDRKFLYPDTPVITELKRRVGIDRFWSIGEGTVVRNFANQLGLYSPEGYESFNSKRYGELIFSSHNKGQLPQQLQRADALLYPAKNMQELSENVYTKKLLRMLGITYIAAFSETGKTPVGFTKIWSDKTYDIYRYDNALPRFFLTNQFIVEKDPQRILDSLYSSDALILEKQPSITPTQATGSATLVSYEPEKIIFKTSATGDEFLFLSDTFYPGWIATVDNIKIPIYRANYAFRAVVVPKGEHTIIMEYKPISVTIGGVLSVIGIILFGSTLYLLRKK